MKVGEYILDAIRKQAQGEVAVHIANIKVIKQCLLVSVNILISQKQ